MQLELDACEAAVGIGLDNGLTTHLRIAQLTGSTEGSCADECEGLISGDTSIGVERQKVNYISDRIPIPLEIGDDVAVAGPDTRFIEGVVNEGVIAGATGHGVVSGATDENVVPASAGKAVGPRRP